MKCHPAKQIFFVLPALALLTGSASVEMPQMPQAQSAPQVESEAQPECEHSRMRCDARIVIQGVEAMLLQLMETDASHEEDAGKVQARNQKAQAENKHQEARTEDKQLKKPKEQDTRTLSDKGLAGARQIGGPRDGWWASLAALNGKLYAIEWIDGTKSNWDPRSKGALWEFSPQEGLSGASARRIGAKRKGNWNSLAALNGKLYAIVGDAHYIWDTDRGFLMELSPEDGLIGASGASARRWARQIGGPRDGWWSSLAALNGKLYAIRVDLNDVLYMGLDILGILLRQIDSDEKGVLWDFLYGLRNAILKGVLWEFSPREGLGGASARQIGGSRDGAWSSLAALNGKLYAIDSDDDFLWEFSPQEGLDGASARRIGGKRKGVWASLAALNGKLYAIDSDFDDYEGTLWEID